jgi:hypothetical protein
MKGAWQPSEHGPRTSNGSALTEQAHVHVPGAGIGEVSWGNIRFWMVTVPGQAMEKRVNEVLIQ